MSTLAATAGGPSNGNFRTFFLMVGDILKWFLQVIVTL